MFDAEIIINFDGIFVSCSCGMLYKDLYFLSCTFCSFASFEMVAAMTEFKSGVQLQTPELLCHSNEKTDR